MMMGRREEPVSTRERRAQCAYASNVYAKRRERSKNDDDDDDERAFFFLTVMTIIRGENTRTGGVIN